MLKGTRQWFWRNRTRFAVGVSAIGGIVLAGQYAWSKWLEVQQRNGEERIAKENLRRRFEQNQEDCTYTVLALLPTVRDEILLKYAVEEITSELQKQKSDRLQRSVGGLSEVASTDLPSGPPSAIVDESVSSSSFIHASQVGESTISASSQVKPKRTKVQLWYDMKVQSITRALTLVYTVSLLALLTRIQLNLLGRRTYLSSVVSLAAPPSDQQASYISLENHDDDNYDNVYGSDFETNRQYLTFSWWLLHRGCKDIAERVEQAVKEVFGPINPREDVTLERLSELILEVRKKVEGATEQERQETRWLKYLLPPKEQEEAVLRRQSGSPSAESPEDVGDSANPLESSQNELQQPIEFGPSLRRLLDETSDLIDSPTFSHVLTQLLNATISHLVDIRVATEAFKLPAPTTANIIDPSNRIQEISDRKVKLAQTLAIFCRQAHAIAAGGVDVDEVGGPDGGPANEYLTAIDGVKDLEAFAAVIYSSNFEWEAIQEEQQKLREQREMEQRQEREHGVLPRVVEEPLQVLNGKADEPAEDTAGSSMFESAWVKAVEAAEDTEPISSSLSPPPPLPPLPQQQQPAPSPEAAATPHV